MKWISFLSMISVGLVSSSIQAAIVHPGSLNPGDQYRYAFVTSTTRDATSSNIADYDDHVNAAIDAADPTGLGAIDWRVWGSTTTVDAIDHLSVDSSMGWDTSDVPIYVINTDHIVARDFADLTDGRIAWRIDRDEFGSQRLSRVWTGTLSNGDRDPGEELGATLSRSGSAEFNNNDWTSYLITSATGEFGFYGFSDVITVSGGPTVPEPSSMALAIFGIGTLIAVRIRRRITQMA